MRNAPRMEWPADDFSRIPFAAYHDQEVYVEEQKRVFRGPTWNYLALEAEVPKPGDFVTTTVGDTPVLVNRQEDGQITAFVNRCMHRGSLLRRERQGHGLRHVCVYHQWCYRLDGSLQSVPFSRGYKGQGGLPPDFDKSQIRLRPLTVESYKGVIFGTFSEDAEPLVDYLGPSVTYELDRLFERPVRVLGYQRQRIFGNWKLYNDNVRDPNHGSLLHMFHATFGLYRVSQTGGAKMDDRFRHNITWSAIGTDKEEENAELYQNTEKVFDKGFRLHDPSLLQYKPEFPDNVTLVILSVFPNCVFQQIANSLCTRQIRTKGLDDMELYWTYFTYEDDDEEMVSHRLKQANLVGPGGYISMEDGEAVELVQRAVLREQDQHARVEIGGRGEIHDQENLITEVPIRGFWSYYCELMGFPAGQEAV